MYDQKCRYKQSVELDSSHLPILVIESNEMGVPVKRVEVDGMLKVINNSNGDYNIPDDPATDFYGRISIEVRGESSADFPKRSYDFETQDPDGNDTSVVLLGMPKENDWVLQGPFADKSQIRNAFMYNLARKTGRWHPRVKFCELIMDGEYLGLYTLIEKIKRDSSRVYVAKLKSEEISGEDLTGGYILKFDKGANFMQIQYPKASDLQPEQVNYIRSFYSGYINTLLSNSGLDPEIGYPKYIDYYSLIDYIIFAEMAKNCDAYLYSTYFYKDKDDRNPKLQFGPLWDYDLCFGNAYWQAGDVINAWQFAYPSNYRFRIKRLFQDPGLVNLFQDRWFELRKSFLHQDSLFATIDEMVEELAEPLERNYNIWPVINEYLFTNVYNVADYSEEIAHIKTWLTRRLEWIDENIVSLYYPVTEYSSNHEKYLTDFSLLKVYPNPFSDEINVKLNEESGTNLTFCLIGLDGKVHILPNIYKGGGAFVNLPVPANLPDGFYMLEIRNNGMPVEQRKVVKLSQDND
jgi:hypothetical protein